MQVLLEWIGGAALRANEVRTLSLIKEVLAMKGKRMLTIPIITGVLAFVGGLAIFAPTGILLLEKRFSLRKPP